MNEPVYSFEGAKNRSLTVYENRAVLRISVSDSEGDERTYDRTFLYEDLLAIEFKKGSIQLGSVYFKEEDSDAPNDLFGENTFPFDVKTLPNTEVEGACRFMKKKIREARR